MEVGLLQTLKGYALRERIGAGGFGAVYRAYQTTVGREVAIKVILPGLANQPEFIRRFEGEAQIIARLEHPHIVPLLSPGREIGLCCDISRYPHRVACRAAQPERTAQLD